MMKKHAAAWAALLALSGAASVHAGTITAIGAGGVVSPADIESLRFNVIDQQLSNPLNLADLGTWSSGISIGELVYQPPQFPPVALTLGAAMSCSGGTINIDTTSNLGAALSCNGDLLVNNGEVSVTGGLLMSLSINATGSLVIGEGATLTSLSGMSLSSGAGGILVESGATLNGALWLFSEGNVTIREGAILNSGSGVAYAPSLSVGGETLLPGGQVSLASGSVISLVPEAGSLPMMALGLGVIGLAGRGRLRAKVQA